MTTAATDAIAARTDTERCASRLPPGQARRRSKPQPLSHPRLACEWCTATAAGRKAACRQGATAGFLARARRANVHFLLPYAGAYGLLDRSVHAFASAVLAGATFVGIGMEPRFARSGLVGTLLVGSLLMLAACDRRDAAPAAAPSAGTTASPSASSATQGVTPQPGDVPAAPSANGPSDGSTAIGGMAAGQGSGKTGSGGGAPAPTGGDGAASKPATAASN